VHGGKAQILYARGLVVDDHGDDRTSGRRRAPPDACMHAPLVWWRVDNNKARDDGGGPRSIGQTATCREMEQAGLTKKVMDGWRGSS
jgi:hypothetical protein